MKKSVLMWVVMLTIGVSTTFAKNEEAVNKQILESFKKEFGTAKEVIWEKTETFVKATFSMNERVLFAYYNQDGELLALTRNIVSDQLPLNLMTSLKKNFMKDYWITNLFEMVSNSHNSYYVTIESADMHIILKSDDSGGWMIYKKEKKDFL